MTARDENGRFRFTRRAALTSLGAAAVGAGSLYAASAASQSNTSTSLLLNWKPNGLHVPYYVAKDRGYYRDQGVELTEIREGQGSDFSAKQVGLGKAPLGITSGDQVVNINSRGVSPQSVGVVMQRSPVVLFTVRRNLGGEFTSVDQLAGKTVGTGPGMVRILTRLFLSRRGVLDQVEIVDTGYDTVQQLLTGKIDAAGGVFADAITAGHQNTDVTVDSIPVADAVPSYGHVVATNRQFAAENGDAVRGFLRATARGAAWATNNPEKAIDAFVNANSTAVTTRSITRQTWETLATEFMLSAAVRKRGWGWSRAEPWEVTHRALRDAELLGGDVDPASVWTNEYLDADYRYVGSYADVTASATATTDG